jgi:hypothetical protein
MHAMSKTLILYLCERCVLQGTTAKVTTAKQGAPGAGAIEAPLLLELRLSLSRRRKQLRPEVAQRQLRGRRDLTCGTDNLRDSNQRKQVPELHRKCGQSKIRLLDHCTFLPWQPPLARMNREGGGITKLDIQMQIVVSSEVAQLNTSSVMGGISCAARLP